MLDAEGKPDFHKLSFARPDAPDVRDPARRARVAGDVHRVRSARAPAATTCAACRCSSARRCCSGSCRRSARCATPITSPTHGEALLAQVVARGLEGVVAKKASSPYRSNALARLAQDEGGSRGRLRGVRLHAAEGHAHRARRAAPVRVGRRSLGVGRQGRLGLRRQAARRSSPQELVGEAALEADVPAPRGERATRCWIEPELVVQVRYREWPEDSSLRFPVFERLRRDKPAHECAMPMRRTGEVRRGTATSPGPATRSSSWSTRRSASCG